MISRNGEPSWTGPLGISYPPVGQDSPYFQVRRLATYEPGDRGAFAYCWEQSQPRPTQPAP